MTGEENVAPRMTAAPDAIHWWPAGVVSLLLPVDLVASMVIASEEGDTTVAAEPIEIEQRVEGSALTHLSKMLQGYTVSQNQQAGDAESDVASHSYQEDKPPTLRERFTAYRGENGETVRHGMRTIYFDGVRVREEQWVHGKRHGRWVEWEPQNETKLAEGEFDYGSKRGFWVTYFEPVEIIDYSKREGQGAASELLVAKLDLARALLRLRRAELRSASYIDEWQPHSVPKDELQRLASAEFSEAELRAAKRINERQPGAVTETEMRRLRLAVDVAKARLKILGMRSIQAQPAESEN